MKQSFGQVCSSCLAVYKQTAAIHSTQTIITPLK